MRETPPPEPSVDDEVSLRRHLLAWFGREARDLPWRRHRTLYGTWISEIMLQQTTVAAVVPYWERFLARFPDVTTLAAADEEEVLALWSGLGYYRRARDLLAAAREIVQRRQGRLPADRAGWATLPGIGPYASGAIASLALGEAAPAVDANVRRVVTRWAADSAAAAARIEGRRLDELAAALVPHRSPGPWNEAVMELGALVCTARGPRCGECPVRDECRAGRAGTAAGVPPPRKRPAPTPVLTGMLVARRGRSVLLMPPGAGCVAVVNAAGEPLRADLAGLHRGLWGLPGTPWYADGQEEFAGAAAAAWRGWLAAHGAPGAEPVAAGRVTHAITRWRLRVLVHTVEIPRPQATAFAAACSGRWRDPRRELPVSRLAARIMADSSRNRDGG